MFLYYQESTERDPETGEGERWKAIKDTPETREQLRKRGVAMVSMLAISSKDTDTDYERLKYRGDLYFDIDNENLEVSITSVQELVQKLKDLGVHNIHVFLSGKKGFHVTVPRKVFFSGGNSGVKWLPYICGYLAAEYFAVEGLDQSVYSGGKGRLWRQPNVKRSDNGKYKVPIRLEDLAGLTVERYVELTSNPNEELLEYLEKEDPVFCIELSSMFEDAATYVRKEQESKEVYRFEVTPELEMLSEAPGCIRKLAAGEDVKDGTNFNRAAMNLAGYLKSANKIGTELETELVEMLAGHNNYGSATYTTARARKQHIKGAIRRATKDRSMGCNPAYILSTVHKCGGCVVCNGTLSKDKDGNKGDGKKNPLSEDGLRNNVFEVGLSYYKEYGPRSVKPLTTFVIEPICSDIYYNMEQHDFRREALKCRIKYSASADAPVRTTHVTIEEDAWDSPTLFKKQFKGIDNVAITCSEDDLADLRHYIMSKNHDIDYSIRSQTVGLAVQEIPSGTGTTNKVLVYAEPGYTAVGNGQSVPVHYEENPTERLSGTPCIREAEPLSPDNEDDVRVCKDLFMINDPDICASLIGWFAATAIKPHLMGLHSEFPLLSITGRPGTGKTTLAAIMADLAGCTYGKTGEPPSAASTQAFIERLIASSTSTPRILDEVNPPAFKNNPKLLETLKGAYNALEIGKSQGLQQGKSNGMRCVKLTGSLVCLSEQPLVDDALRQRMIEAMLDKRCHGVDESGAQIDYGRLPDRTLKIIKSFEYMTEHEQRDRIRSIGRAIIHQALKTNMKTVKESLAKYNEPLRNVRCHGRQRYCWRVVLVGLDLYETALREQYDIDVSEEVAKAKEDLIDRLLDADVTNSGAENCNNEVISFIASMAERSAIAELQNIPAQVTLPRPFAYRKSDECLYLNLGTFWSDITGKARQTNTRLKYSSLSQFVTAIKTEAYFVAYSGGMLQLNLNSMKASGINIDAFYSDDDFETKKDAFNGVF